MSKPSIGAMWAGVDWSDRSHDVCLVDAEGERVAAFKIPHSAEGIAELVKRLGALPTVGGVAIEAKQHLVVQGLLEAGIAVFPINPKMSRRWVESLSVAGAKSDPAEAFALADGLRHHHKHLRPLELDDELTRTLMAHCRAESKLITHRTALVNRLQATLKTYFPAALDWFSDWTKPTAWDFVLTFPRPEALQQASRRKLIGFLRRHHIGLSPIWEARLGQRTDAVAWPSDPVVVEVEAEMAITLAKLLRTLEPRLKLHRAQIETLFAQHADAAIFRSLPGAGRKLAPRLLSHFGSRRDRYDSAQALQLLSGCVPVSHQSGNSDPAYFRQACQKDFRTTMHLFASLSIQHSIWARACYERARGRGKPYAHALRIVGAKWLKIIFRMWQTGTPYDERAYLASLIRHGSPLIDHIKASNKCGELIEKHLT